MIPGPENLNRKISIGTVQFGTDYGIANNTGRVSKKNAGEILKYSYGKDIRTIDTAFAYGDSETVIGEILSETGLMFDIVSKMPGSGNVNSLNIEGCCRRSLERLRQDRIYGYMMHETSGLMQDVGIWSELEKIKTRGLAEKIGVSIYKPGELEFLLKNTDPDMIQLPYNILDQRFEEYFPVLDKKGIEIHVRSVFLQGLFFLDKVRIEKDFKPAKRTMEEIEKLCKESGIPVNALCLCFVLINPLLDKVVIGVDSAGQLSSNIEALTYIDKINGFYDRLKRLGIDDETVILPYNWRT